jgi:hypothetical protein
VNKKEILRIKIRKNRKEKRAEVFRSLSVGSARKKFDGIEKKIEKIRKRK